MKTIIAALTITATALAGPYTWTGYFVYPSGGNKITSVEGTWKVPAFKASRGSVYIWPGIGGSISFQQCGTLCNIDRKGNSINYTWSYELSDDHPAIWLWLMNGNTYDTTFSATGKTVTARVEVVDTGVSYHVTHTMTSGTRVWVVEMDDSLFTGATGEWLYEVPSGKPILAEPLTFTGCRYQCNYDPTWYVLGQPCAFAQAGGWHDSGGTMSGTPIVNGSFSILNP